MTHLTPDMANGFATLTLSHLGRRYPYKMDLVLAGPQDAREPADHHPIFHGSFDWHSCVHGWWQVMRLLRLYPDMPQARPFEPINSTALIRQSVKNRIMKSDQYPIGGGMNICFNVLKSKASRSFESRHRIFRPTVLITAMSESENSAVF